MFCQTKATDNFLNPVTDRTGNPGSPCPSDPRKRLNGRFSHRASRSQFPSPLAPVVAAPPALLLRLRRTNRMRQTTSTMLKQNIEAKMCSKLLLVSWSVCAWKI